MKKCWDWTGLIAIAFNFWTLEIEFLARDFFFFLYVFASKERPAFGISGLQDICIYSVVRLIWNASMYVSTMGKGDIWLNMVSLKRTATHFTKEKIIYSFIKTFKWDTYFALLCLKGLQNGRRPKLEVQKSVSSRPECHQIYFVEKIWLGTHKNSFQTSYLDLPPFGAPWASKMHSILSKSPEKGAHVFTQYSV